MSICSNCGGPLVRACVRRHKFKLSRGCLGVIFVMWQKKKKKSDRLYRCSINGPEQAAGEEGGASFTLSGTHTRSRADDKMAHVQKPIATDVACGAT